MKTSPVTLLITPIPMDENESTDPAGFPLSMDWEKAEPDALSGTIDYFCETDKTALLKIGFILYSAAQELSSTIERLNGIVYRYNGRRHEPRALSIDIGRELMSPALMSSMDVAYKTFDKTGVPISARVSMEFVTIKA